jgi:hypothetical protein
VQCFTKQIDLREEIQMKNRYFYIIWWAVLMLVLTACGPGAADLALTVESQVAAAVLATQAALPTPTMQSTFTPYPTYTPQATWTPYPTLTPYPTQTPLPTYTPLPTETAVATETATATATAVPTVNAAIPAATTAASTGGSTTSDREQLAASITTVLNHIDSYAYEIRPKPLDCYAPWGCRTVDYKANCTALVHAYDGIVNGRPAGFAPSDPQVQAAYATFGAAIDTFSEVNKGWADGCREALATGQQKEVSFQQADFLMISINPIIHTLNQLVNELRQ